MAANFVRVARARRFAGVVSIFVDVALSARAGFVAELHAAARLVLANSFTATLALWATNPLAAGFNSFAAAVAFGNAGARHLHAILTV